MTKKTKERVTQAQMVIVIVHKTPECVLQMSAMRWIYPPALREITFADCMLLASCAAGTTEFSMFIALLPAWIFRTLNCPNRLSELRRRKHRK